MSGLSSDQGSTDNISAVLSLMANPAALKAMYAELDKRKKDADAAVAKVGPAKDIEKLRAEAVKDREAAAQELISAKAQAKSIVDAANVAAGSATEAAQLRNSALDAASERKVKEADARVKVVDKTVADASAQAQRADAKQRDAEQREALVAKREADVKIATAENAAKAKFLKEIRDKISAYLAEQTKAL
jgi:hypothetical protein